MVFLCDAVFILLIFIHAKYIPTLLFYFRVFLELVDF